MTAVPDHYRLNTFSATQSMDDDRASGSHVTFESKTSTLERGYSSDNAARPESKNGEEGQQDQLQHPSIPGLVFRDQSGLQKRKKRRSKNKRSSLKAAESIDKEAEIESKKSKVAAKKGPKENDEELQQMFRYSKSKFGEEKKLEEKAKREFAQSLVYSTTKEATEDDSSKANKMGNIHGPLSSSNFAYYFHFRAN